MIKVTCLVCANDIYKSPSKVRPRNFCSMRCWSKISAAEVVERGSKFRFVKGRAEVKNRLEAIRKIRGGTHYAWKGSDVSYRGLHQWVRRLKGTPSICSQCGKNDKRPRAIQWANVDGMYRRDINDFVALCVSCHKLKDLKMASSNQGEKSANV